MNRCLSCYLLINCLCSFLKVYTTPYYSELLTSFPFDKYIRKNLQIFEKKKYLKASMGKFLKEKQKKVKQKCKVNRNFLKITLKINIINIEKKLFLLIRKPPAPC
jgi:hypothetical protein